MPESITTIKVKLDLEGLAQDLRDLADRISPQKATDVLDQVANTHILGSEHTNGAGVLGYTACCVAVAAPQRMVMHGYVFGTIGEAEEALEAWAPETGRVVAVVEVSNV